MNLRVLFVFLVLEVLSIGNMGAPLEIFREEDTKGKVGVVWIKALWSWKEAVIGE